MRKRLAKIIIILPPKIDGTPEQRLELEAGVEHADLAPRGNAVQVQYPDGTVYTVVVTVQVVEKLVLQDAPKIRDL